ncbi:protein PAT1 homolog 1 [Neolamprologus brichardi]|uniref:protein PAT1 homolog 1 n=1 Tax=Neolamprologus brichardi TaxID=32507 RepID=UPI001643967F|nr:protein PAT1 homolog 1 [Neolamprologus brichardi]
MFRFQSLDEDCMLEEEDDGLIEDEDEIDQFNDDTFGAGAIDDDWQEEHKRLAELDERDELGAGLGFGGGGMGGDSDLSTSERPSSTRIPSSVVHPPPPSSLASLSFSSSSSRLPPSDVEDRVGEGDLAESLARLILDADPAIAGVGAAERPGLPPGSSGSGLSALRGLDQPRVLPQPSPILPPTQPHQHPQHQLPPGLPASGENESTASLEDLRFTELSYFYRCHQDFKCACVCVCALTVDLLSHDCWSQLIRSVCRLDNPLMSIIKEVGHPKRAPQGRNDEDLSERAPPPRSSSPVIGSPPVRAVPIGTPPKQPMSHALNHQIHHPTAVHVRAPVQHRYPAPFPERLSPNTLLNIANSPLCRGPFPPRVGPVLSQIQRAQLLNSQTLLTACRHSWQSVLQWISVPVKRASNCPESTLSSKASRQIEKCDTAAVWFCLVLNPEVFYQVSAPVDLFVSVFLKEKREKQVWNKRRQILYTVEKMYSLLLEVQDFEKCFVQAPEEDREALLEQHKSNTEQLCSSLREKEWDDRVSDEQCVMIMSVRKGKRLISRLLPFLPSTQAAAVVMAIARNLPALAKKDKQDQVLCWLVEPVSAVIQSLSSASLTDLLQELQGSEGQLATVLHNKVRAPQPGPITERARHSRSPIATEGNAVCATSCFQSF